MWLSEPEHCACQDLQEYHCIAEFCEYVKWNIRPLINHPFAGGITPNIPFVEYVDTPVASDSVSVADVMPSCASLMILRNPFL